MTQVAYTNHIGRSSRDNHSGKNTAICNLADLAAVEKHNNHDYTQEDVDRMESAINLNLKGYNSQYVMVDGELTKIDGHIDLEARVRTIYKEQFTAAVDDYNQRQVAAGHPGRQICSYINKISGSKQQEVAVEGLIQFGSFEDWADKTMEEKQQVVPLLLQSLKDTLAELKHDDVEFVLAGASVHLNEGSPHLHYVGVPVQHAENAHNGPKTRVSKSAVFTRDTLGAGLQDNVRAKIEPQLMATFGWEFEKKKAGRNQDLSKNQIANDKLQEQIHKRENDLRALNLGIAATYDAMEHDIQTEIDRRINGIVLDGTGTYDNALFYLSVCSEENLQFMNDEGRRMKEIFAESMSKSLAAYDVVSHNLQRAKSGSVTAKPISWSDRQARWEDYRFVSDSFWMIHENLMDRHKERMKGAYNEKRACRESLFDAQYLLYHSRNILVRLFAYIWMLLEVEAAKFRAWEVEQARKSLAKLAEQTADFATFSRTYREDLKAGRVPCEEHLQCMAKIVEKMDAEYQRFLDQDARRAALEREQQKMLEQAGLDQDAR